MKLLVFSDSHHCLQPMLEAVRVHAPDRVLHLGDLFRDAGALAAACPGLPVTAVPGNCDGWRPAEPPVRLLTVAGRHILMGHGHLWGVKRGYGGAEKAARGAGADIVLFGHTHRAFCDCTNGLWMMNPGAVGGGGASSYGIILLENERILCYTLSN